MATTSDTRVAVRHGTVIFETVRKTGPGWHTDVLSIDIDRDQASDLFLALDAAFDLVQTPPPMLPRDVFDALPPAKKTELMERGFQLYDAPEDLRPDALAYEVTLKRP